MEPLGIQDRSQNPMFLWYMLSPSVGGPVSSCLGMCLSSSSLVLSHLPVLLTSRYLCSAIRNVHHMWGDQWSLAGTNGEGAGFGEKQVRKNTYKKGAQMGT